MYCTIVFISLIRYAHLILRHLNADQKVKYFAQFNHSGNKYVFLPHDLENQSDTVDPQNGNQGCVIMEGCVMKNISQNFRTKSHDESNSLAWFKSPDKKCVTVIKFIMFTKTKSILGIGIDYKFENRFRIDLIAINRFSRFDSEIRLSDSINRF